MWARRTSGCGEPGWAACAGCCVWGWPPAPWLKRAGWLPRASPLLAAASARLPQPHLPLNQPLPPLARRPQLVRPGPVHQAVPLAAVPPVCRARHCLPPLLPAVCVRLGRRHRARLPRHGLLRPHDQPADRAGCAAGEGGWQAYRVLTACSGASQLCDRGTKCELGLWLALPMVESMPPQRSVPNCPPHHNPSSRSLPSSLPQSRSCGATRWWTSRAAWTWPSTPRSPGHSQPARMR